MTVASLRCRGVFALAYRSVAVRCRALSRRVRGCPSSWGSASAFILLPAARPPGSIPACDEEVHRPRPTLSEPARVPVYIVADRNAPVAISASSIRAGMRSTPPKGRTGYLDRSDHVSPFHGSTESHRCLSCPAIPPVVSIARGEDPCPTRWVRHLSLEGTQAVMGRRHSGKPSLPANPLQLFPPLPAWIRE